MSTTEILPIQNIPFTFSVHNQNKLFSIHKKIDHISFKECFKTGWRALEKRNRPFISALQKTLAVFGGCFIVFYSGSSFVFASLSLKEGIMQFKESSKAPIIGHFSEWSLQGFFSLAIYAKAIYEICLLGCRIKAEKIFKKTLKEDLNPEEKDMIYEDYLEFVRNTPFTSAVYISSFPKPIKPTWDFSTTHDSMSLDYQLKKTYSSIHKQFIHISFMQQVKEGWHVICSEKSVCSLTMIKTALFSSSLFFMIHVINYPLGIYWSGRQAKDDYEKHINPSIGGHTLEWSAEWFATINLFFYYFSEIANVGKAKLLSDLFHGKMKELEKKSGPLWQEQSRRLYFEMRKQLNRIPQGYFFKIPSRFAFPNMDVVPNEEQESNA